jgi:hypothetical protein
MFRIDTPNKAVDLFGAGKHGFRDGDMGAGLNPTELSADQQNSLQEELAGIIEAAGIALDKNNLTQLLTALRSAGVFQTAAQFDSSTKAATTAFLRANAGNLSGVYGVAAVSTLPASVAGKLVLLGGGSGYTTTLPLISSVPIGTKISFASQGGGVMSIARQGADVVYIGGAAYTVNTISGNDCATYVASSAGVWTVSDGALPFQTGGSGGVFGSNKVANGYQKLPSGIIIQWGSGTSSGTAPGNATISLPIAFPSSFLSGQAGVLSSGVANSQTMQIGSWSVTSMPMTALTNGVITSGMGFTWLAIGY